MATAAQVIKAALQRILVQASEQELQPDEYQDAIFAMNNYMLALDAEGVTLGYTEVTNLGDDVTIPVGALRGLIGNLAMEVAPDYGGIITPALQIQAKAGYDAMVHLGNRLGVTNYPSTLPIGSGNEDTTYLNRHFYPETEAQILAETSGAIGLEVNTNTVAETTP
jgi:hypothetical protein